MRLAMLACVAAAFTWAGGPAEAAVAERSCHIEEFETPVRCVTVDVPRDYDRPEDGAVKVTAVIIPASTGRPSPDPVVLLAGGPGQSASSLAGLLPALIREARKTRDVVLFDLRGTGFSGPLDCQGFEKLGGLVADASAPAPDSLAQIGAFARECLARHGETARHHTSREAVEDLERFRQAMGYPALNLWGGSFGTRVAQHYVRAYGARTRVVVLDAAAPVGVSILGSGAKTPDKALEIVIAACEKDASCAQRFPTFRADVAAVLARADAGPIVGAMADPTSGVRGRVALDRISVGNAIRVALYSKTTAELLPFAVAEAAKDNWGPILAMASAAVSEQLAMGAQFSMLCAEDWRQADGLDPAERTGALMKDGYFRFFSPACEVWPTDTVPAGMLAPFKSNIPALVISGAYDPVTPPELGEQTLAQFENGRHLVLANGFHGNSTSPCMARIIGRFLENPAAQPDEACIARLPSLHFFLGAAG
jgi:pimeloyl-ACP methyl ester carboxylesterase